MREEYTVVGEFDSKKVGKLIHMVIIQCGGNACVMPENEWKLMCEKIYREHRKKNVAA